MSIKTKLNTGILTVLIITFLCLTIVINFQIKANESALVEAILDKIKGNSTAQVTSLVDNFTAIEDKLTMANRTTRDTVTDIYISSYGILTKSLASRIFPFVVDFEIEAAEKLIQGVLKENPSISWVSYSTSEQPDDSEHYEQGVKLAGDKQEVFSHVIKDDLNFLEVLVQVNLEGLEAVSKIEASFSQINRENRQLVERIRSDSEQSLEEIKAASISAALQGLRSMNIKLCVIMALAFCIVAVVLFSVSRSIILPILKAVKYAETIAEGDFQQTIDCNRKDEIGTLIQSLSHIASNLGQMLKELKNEAIRLSDSSLDLSSVSDSVSSVSKRTSARTQKVTGAAQSINHDMKELVNSTDQAVNHIDTISIAADGMNQTISEVARASEETRDRMAHVVKLAQRAFEKTTGLEKSARDITAITETITEISENTNLLALNATIEAARAGESGRGFAVVAGEIKELAGQTAQATFKIKDHIEGIQTSTGQTVHEISEITELIRGVDDMAVNMADSMEAQSGKTKEIADNVAQTSIGIKEITSNLTTSRSSVESITQEIEKLDKASGVLASDSLNVNQKSSDLHKISTKLFEFVGNFKL